MPGERGEAPPFWDWLGEVAATPKLTDASRHVALVIAHHAMRSRRFYGSVGSIMAATGLSRRGVQSALKRLVEAKLLRVIAPGGLPGKKRRATEYALVENGAMSRRSKSTGAQARAGTGARARTGAAGRTGTRARTGRDPRMSASQPAHGGAPQPLEPLEPEPGAPPKGSGGALQSQESPGGALPQRPGPLRVRPRLEPLEGQELAERRQELARQRDRLLREHGT